MLATDGSPTAEKATETAIELAHLLDTELVIVSVWDIPYATVGLAPMPITGELALAGREEAEKAAGEAASSAEDAGVEVTKTFPIRPAAAGAIPIDPTRPVVIMKRQKIATIKEVFGTLKALKSGHGKLKGNLSATVGLGDINATTRFGPQTSGTTVSGFQIFRFAKTRLARVL